MFKIEQSLLKHLDVFSFLLYRIHMTRNITENFWMFITGDEFTQPSVAVSGRSRRVDAAKQSGQTLNRK